MNFRDLIGRVILGPEVLYDCFIDLKNLNFEVIIVVLLDFKKRVVQIKKIQQGHKKSVIMNPREILNLCIEKNSNDLVLIHNHPSGSNIPSTRDIYSTRILKNRLFFFEINLLDHIIISNSFFSFKDSGLL